MKIIQLILLSFISCNGQSDNAAKLKNMKIDTFDVKSFENFVEKGGNKNSLRPYVLESIKNDTIIRKSSAIYPETGEREYQEEIIPPVPNLFYSLTIYDNEGKVKNSIDKVFIGVFDFDYGMHNFYNKDGYLTKQIDNSKQFDLIKVKVDDLLTFLSQEDIKINQIDPSAKTNLKDKWFPNNENVSTVQVLNKIEEIFLETKEERGKFEKKIINPYNRQDVERIKIDFDSKNKYWIIVKDFSILGKITIYVDGNEKRILKSTYTL